MHRAFAHLACRVILARGPRAAFKDSAQLSGSAPRRLRDSVTLTIHPCQHAASHCTTWTRMYKNPFLFFRDFLFFLRNFHVSCSRTSSFLGAYICMRHTSMFCVCPPPALFPTAFPLLLLAYFSLTYESFLEQVNLAEHLTSSDFGVSTGLISQGYWEASKWYFVNVERGNIAD
jgi:hypothetical protein